MSLGENDAMTRRVAPVIDKVGVRVERAGQTSSIGSPSVTQSVHIEISNPRPDARCKENSLCIGKVLKIG